MKVLIWLALKSLRHHPWRNLLLMLCLGAVTYIPWVSSILLQRYDQDLNARAVATPLVLGQPGNRFDLCLGALFFRRAELPPMAWSDYESIAKRRGLLAVPMHLGFSVQDLPLVCTTPEYFEQRALVCKEGHGPFALRQITLGAKAAAELQVQVGDRLHSDPTAGFGLSGAPAQSLLVVGILKATHGPDDRALFASIQTAWLLEGALHGHTNVDTLQSEAPDLILATGPTGSVLSGALVPDQTQAQSNPVHLHKDPTALPLSTILLWPETDKVRTLLQAEVESQNALAILRPTSVIGDLMRYTLRFKILIDRLVLMLGLGMLVLFGLVTALSSQMRSREWVTLRRLGAPPGTVPKLLLVEVGLIGIAGLCLAAGATWMTVQWLPNLIHAL